MKRSSESSIQGTCDRNAKYRRFCNSIGCKIRASFGFQNEHAQKCKKHADPEMANVVEKNVTTLDVKKYQVLESLVKVLLCANDMPVLK